jgi:phospholipid/cholesterol/gamma-HCH transport system substrate-binding protein
MKRLDRKTARATVRLTIFVVVTTMATALLAVTIGNIGFGATQAYSAVFTEATGVVEGDDVRVAGVKVGTVQDVGIVDRDRALVRFEVDEGTPLTRSTHVTIRYRNLVGQRYLALTEEPGALGVLEEGATIPVDRTHPALDLTVLLNGFKPLFAAMSPSDVNKLSMELVKVFQGEGGTLEGLLGSTASVTNTLAARDELIGDLIANLNETLETVGDRDRELSQLIVRTRRLVGGLSRDREAILGSLDSISGLAVETADLVGGARPGLTKDIRELRKVTRNIDDNRAELDRAIKVLPIKLEKVGRTAIYGSWFNFYLCEFTGTVKVGGQQLRLPRYPQDVPGVDQPARCDI